LIPNNKNDYSTSINWINDFLELVQNLSFNGVSRNEKFVTLPTFHKSFQNPINISIKEETNQIVELICVCEMKKQKIQDVVEVVSSNTFASIQQVSEDNLKEFLVSILCL
jgi:hypothetical protein